MYVAQARGNGPGKAQAQAQADAIGLNVDEAAALMSNNDAWIRSKNFQDALFNWVDEATLRPGPHTRPARFSDPRFMLIGYLKDFPWAMQAKTLSYLVQQSRLQPGLAEQLTPWLAAAIPMMIAGSLGAYVRDLITNQGPAAALGIQPLDRYAHASRFMSDAVTRSGLLGPFELLYTFGTNYEYRGIPWLNAVSPLATLMQDMAQRGSGNVAMHKIPVIAQMARPVQNAILSRYFGYEANSEGK